MDSILDRLPTATIINEEDFTDEKGKERKAYTIKSGGVWERDRYLDQESVGIMSCY